MSCVFQEQTIFLSQAGKTVPSPTERSPIPPTTKRTVSWPTLGNSDEFKFIGFDPEVQASMNSHKLSWAVQYEISRFRSQSNDYCFTADEYARIFPDLQGGNDKARHVVHLLRTLVRDRRDRNIRSAELQAHLDAIKRRVEELERAEKDPYVELDKEEATIEAGKQAGLGLTSDGPDPDWYGGQGKPFFLTVELLDKATKSTPPQSLRLLCWSKCRRRVASPPASRRPRSLLW